MKHIKRILILFVTFSISACFHQSDSDRNPSPGIVCTEEAKAGINLVVTEKGSGEPLASQVKAIIRDGDYREKLEYFDVDDSDAYLSGAYERTGKYKIIVKLDGYQDWKKSGVVVTEDECHVIPKKINVKLVKL